MANKPISFALAVHLSLELGRLLIANGAETEAVQHQVKRLARALGSEARLVVTGEALLLTVTCGDDFRTKVGRPIAGAGVNVDKLAALDRIVVRAEAGTTDADAISAELDAVEQRKPLYPGYVVAVAMGLTGGCLARLFGGDLTVALVAFIAGTVGTAIRLMLGRWGVGSVAIPFFATLAGGLVGGIGMRLFPSPNGALCLIAPAMLLVPGAPIVNALRDVFTGHAGLGVARLCFSVLVVFAIALALLVANLVTGVTIPIIAALPLLPVPEDMLFSALAAIGFCCLFSVPARICWACCLCGLSSHTLRTALAHFGVDLAVGTLIGALVAGTLATLLARAYDAPPAAFAFPGVLAMIPGSYAFRAFLGSLDIMQQGDRVSFAMLADTASLTLSTLFLCMAIAIGIGLPLGFYRRRTETARQNS